MAGSCEDHNEQSGCMEGSFLTICAKRRILDVLRKLWKPKQAVNRFNCELEVMEHKWISNKICLLTFQQLLAGNVCSDTCWLAWDYKFSVLVLLPLKVRLHVTSQVHIIGWWICSIKHFILFLRQEIRVKICLEPLHHPRNGTVLRTWEYGPASPPECGAYVSILCPTKRPASTGDN
jgi:hypothetical protein